MVITVRQLSREELVRAAEIDISGEGVGIYRMVAGELCLTPEPWQTPAWSAVEWQAHLADWESNIGFDLLLGAFAGERLVGLASLRYQLTATMAQLVSLHVDRNHRRLGAATQLVQEIIRLAQTQGAQALYVSATESSAAVGFYRSHGFRPTADVDPYLFALEPKDIHMVREL